MSILETLNNGESGLIHRTKINDNFTALNTDKVEKVTGKDLSTNDFSDAYKNKIDGIEAGAEANTLNDIIAGTNVTIDKTDPLNPVINSTGGGGSGDVVGPASSTDSSIALFDGVTGKLLKDSSKTIVTTLGGDDTTVPTSKAVADAIGGAGGGDMLKTVYDPQNINLDAFDRTNHTGTQSIDTITETTDKKVMTNTEREKLEDVDLRLQTSGWISGGDLTATIGQTTFSLTAGTGKIINSETRTDVSWNDFNNISITNIGTQPATLIGIDINGDLVQDPLPLTREGIRNKIYLKLIIHTQGVIEQVQDAYSALDVNVSAQVTDLALALGAINLSGNGLGPNGVNMKIDKAAGTLFSHLTNYSTNSKDPSTITSAAQTQASFVTTWKDGFGGYNISATQTDVPAGRYDDGTGGVTQPNGTMPSSKYMNYHCYMAITGLIVLQYGNVVYENISDAIVGADSEQFEKNPQLAGALNLGWISLRENATNLSNSSIAYFRPASGISGGGGTGAIFNMQATYDVSSQPQIITNNGSVQLQGGETDTDDVLEIKDTGGTTTATVQANGTPTKGTDLVRKTELDGKVSSDTTGITGADQVTNLVSLTQAEYNAITPDSATTYLITDA